MKTHIFKSFAAIASIFLIGLIGIAGHAAAQTESNSMSAEAAEADAPCAGDGDYHLSFGILGGICIINPYAWGPGQNDKAFDIDPNWVWEERRKQREASR